MADSAKTRAVDSDKVYTTLITNTKYLSGLLTLEYSLRRAGSKYPLLVLYTDTFEKEGHEALDRRGIAKQKIEYLLPKAHKDYSQDVRFYDCWSKLQPFSLYEYSRVVQLDSDMLIIKSIDDLMDVPLSSEKAVFAASHACTCNPLKKPHYPPDWVPETCAHTIAEKTPEEMQVNGPPCHTGLGFCNGGLLVVEPKEEYYSAIMATINQPAATDSYDFADQSLLSDVFANRWLGLSYIYNALKTMRWCHKDLWRDDKVRNVHYILSPKPWDETEEDKKSEKRDGTHQWWWDITEERRADEAKKGVADGW